MPRQIVKNTPRSFFKNQSGNMAILFAVMSFPLIAAVGFVVDYSRISTARSDYQNALDSAVLAAVRAAQDERRNGRNITDSFSMAQDIGKRIFEENTSSVSGTPSSPLQILLNETGGQIQGTAKFSGIIKTTFMSISGVKDAGVDITSEANTARAEFIEVHLVYDTSASMGVGSTASDHTIMANTVSCAFACHTADAHESLWPSSHITTRNAGAELRIDTLKNATEKMVNDLKAEGLEGRELKFAIHTFSNSLTTVTGPTSDLDLVMSRIRSIDLNNQEFQGGTNFERTFSQLDRSISNSSDGSTETRPKRYILFMTDGVETNIRFNSSLLPSEWAEVDPFYARAAGYFESDGFDASVCDTLKNTKNINLFTLNARYNIPTVGTDNDTRFAYIGNTLVPQIEDEMRACASTPDNAYWADTPANIDDAVQAFKEVLSSKALRLTN